MKIKERGEGLLNLDDVWTKTSIERYLDVPIWTSDGRLMDVTKTSVLDSKENSFHILKTTRIMEDHFIDI